MKKVFCIGLLAISVQNAFSGSMGKTQEDSFNGGYIGLGTGVLTNLVKNTYTRTNYGSGLSFGPSINTSSSGIMFSGNIGYGKMISEKTYLGAKAAILYTPISDFLGNGFSFSPSANLVEGNNNITTSYKPIYNLNAVLGYEVYHHILPFIEAGVSATGANRRYVLTRSITNLSSASSVSSSGLVNLNKYVAGYNVGLGTNYHPVQNWIFSGEVLFFGFSKMSKKSTQAVPQNNLISGNLVTTKSLTLNSLALFASASYLFS